MKLSEQKMERQNFNKQWHSTQTMIPTRFRYKLYPQLCKNYDKQIDQTETAIENMLIFVTFTSSKQRKRSPNTYLK